MSFKQKIISIIGQGFIGLPMSIVLSNVKKNNKYIYKVFGIEKLNNNGKRIQTLFKNKKIWINSTDKKLSLNFKKSVNKNFFLTFNYDKIKESEVVILSIGFDFSKKNSIEKIKKTIEKIFENIQENKMLIIETTLPPGTSEKILIPIAKKVFDKRNLDFNKFSFCYSFERIMPGENYLNSIININRVFSGNTLIAKKKCERFLKNFINYKKFKLTCLDKIIDVEATKVFENTYRATNIALIDEWLKFAQKTNINLNQSLEAIRQRPSHSNIRYPGLGVGGYCLTKDPLFLNYSAKKIFNIKNEFPITNTSIKINKKMILNSVNFIRSNLKITNNPKLLIVGMGYKDGVSDLRNSPSMELQKYLLKYNFDVFYYDDLITNVLNTKLKHLDNKEQINHIENIVVCQKTSFFKKIKFNLNNKPKNIFDLNNILSKKLILKIQSSKSKLHILGS